MKQPRVVVAVFVLGPRATEHLDSFWRFGRNSATIDAVLMAESIQLTNVQSIFEGKHAACAVCVVVASVFIVAAFGVVRKQNCRHNQEIYRAREQVYNRASI